MDKLATKGPFGPRFAAAATAALCSLTGAAAWAQDAAAAAPVFDSGDTAWVITAAALVLMMTLPGLALFYGGLVRSKNVLNVLMQCFISAGIAGVLWILIGYSLAFGDGNAFIGDFSKVGLASVTLDSVVTNGADRNIPELIFAMFQGMFAIITPALILGAVAERMKFSVWVAFITIWLLVVYCPLAHMVWGSEGWIFQSGAIDFAGGLVVHMSSGFSALVAAIMLGKRRGFGKEPMPPHSLPLCLIGAGLLWTGWFGFNAGSAVGAGSSAGMAMLVTQICTGTAALAWMFGEWVSHGKPSLLGIISGAVAGLVAITPASGTVGPAGALVIGAVAGVVCFLASTKMKRALGYDDSLDVFGVHAVGGIVGAILTGVFAFPSLGGVWEPGEGATIGAQVWIQTKSVIFTIVYTGVLSFVLLKIVDVIVGLRVSTEQEEEGLDLSLHDERGYNL